MKNRQTVAPIDREIDNLLTTLMADETIKKFEYKKNSTEYKKIKIYYHEKYKDQERLHNSLTGSISGYDLLPRQSKVSTLTGLGKAKYFVLEISKNNELINNFNSEPVMRGLFQPIKNNVNNLNSCSIIDYTDRPAEQELEKDIIIISGAKENSSVFKKAFSLFNKKQSEKVEPLEPDEFYLDPISRRRLENPVLVLYKDHGQTYEKEELINWIAKYHTIPLTGEAIPSHVKIEEGTFYSPNIALKAVIDSMPPEFSFQ